ncbi:MAG: polyprenyl synthetase family protein [Kocuria sp.]|nr:polyprenyl synthetase family protein [Kocuria sp.]
MSAVSSTTGPPGAHRSGIPVTEGDVEAIDQRLKQVLAAAAHRLPTMTRPLIDLFDGLEAMALDGKKVRPLLLMRTFRDLGGVDAASAVEAACASELLHLALLAHDDVIDGDLYRRGAPNIYGRFHADALDRGGTPQQADTWGKASAILAGDILLSAAQGLLARLDVPEERRRAVLDIYDEAILRSASGEHTDVWLALDAKENTTSTILEMMKDKTAVYSFELPVRIGAVLAGAESELTASLAHIGGDLGAIYQLRDDLLGVFGDESRTGKSVVSDLREGKQTLLVAYARGHEEWSDVEECFGDPGLRPEDAERIRAVLSSTGARHRVEKLIEDSGRSLEVRLADSGLPGRLCETLTGMIRYSASRVS